MDPIRALRILAIFAAAWTVLYLRFAAGVVKGTEIDSVVHWALIPIAGLLAVANGAMEINGSGSVPRRDAVWGLCAALASFGILHALKTI